MSTSIDTYTRLGQVEPEPEEPGDVEPEPEPEEPGDVEPEPTPEPEQADDEK